MMDTIKKYKALVSIIIFLLITNFAMLIFFMVISKPVDRKYRNHEQNGIYTLLQKEVGFSKGQLDQYQDLRNQQRKNVSPLFNEIKKSKEDFYDLLYSGNASDSLINADADSIAQTQKKIDLQMFNHFKMVRNICTPDQVQKFDSSMKKVITRMTSRPGRGKPNK
jgi:protein CpxP